MNKNHQVILIFSFFGYGLLYFIYWVITYNNIICSWRNSSIASFLGIFYLLALIALIVYFYINRSEILFNGILNIFKWIIFLCVFSLTLTMVMDINLIWYC